MKKLSYLTVVIAVLTACANANDEVKVSPDQMPLTEKLLKNSRRSINDFTGKLLAEEDGGIITEIEQKFRIAETATKPTEHASLERLDAAIAKVFAAAAAKEGAVQQVFLDRRVKKSYDFHMPPVTGTATATATATTTVATLPHNDFAQTKFTNASHFSTTKFYNEMMMNNNNNTTKAMPQNMSRQYAVLTNPKFKTFRKSQVSTFRPYTPSTPTTITTSTSALPPSSSQMPAHGEVLSAVAVPTQTEAKVALERVKWRLKAILPVANNNNNNSSKSNKYANTHKQSIMQSTLNSTQPTTITTNIESSSTKITTRATATTSNSATRKSIAATPATLMRQRINGTTKIPTTAATTTFTSTASLSQHRATNPTKSSSKPISRPRTLSQLQLKINALECEIANVPPDAHLWRGNETHELLLPIMVSKCLQLSTNNYIFNNCKLTQ